MISAIHIITVITLYVSNSFQNTNVPIHEKNCVGPPHYYLDWLKKNYPYVPLNKDDGKISLQGMNGIKVKNPKGLQYNGLLDAMVTVTKYEKIIIDNAIYIKLFSYITVYYLKVSTDDILNNTNNKTYFPELLKVFKGSTDIKIREVSDLK